MKPLLVSLSAGRAGQSARTLEDRKRIGLGMLSRFAVVAVCSYAGATLAARTAQ
jgi:hypothetical protein